MWPDLNRAETRGAKTAPNQSGTPSMDSRASYGKGSCSTEYAPGVVSRDVKSRPQAPDDTLGMDQCANSAVIEAKLANRRPQLLALAAAGQPSAFDQAWKLLDPIFVEAEAQGLGGSCYASIGKLLADTGLTRRVG